MINQRLKQSIEAANYFKGSAFTFTVFSLPSKVTDRHPIERIESETRRIKLKCFKKYLAKYSSFLSSLEVVGTLPITVPSSRQHFPRTSKILFFSVPYNSLRSLVVCQFYRWVASTLTYECIHPFRTFSTLKSALNLISRACRLYSCSIIL